MGEHDGHRQRIIQRLALGEPIYEHEYLEVLLFNALPRQNTNPIAHRLLAKFGTLKDVVESSISELERVEGVGKSLATYLHCMGRLGRLYPSVRSGDYPEVFDPALFPSFVKSKYKDYTQEHLDIYCVDDSAHIYRMLTFTDMRTGEVRVNSDAICDLLLEAKPSGVIVVHNHPHGACRASTADDQTTEVVEKLCRVYNVIFCDHYIYARNGIYSYRESGNIVDDMQKLFKRKKETVQ
ncbi:MAG: hypothetical protein IJX88_01335 [Clostridia bacterium]|nr:hypothetical protein [Clostridia bacterium]